MEDADRTAATLTAGAREQIASFLHGNRVEVVGLLYGLTQEQSRRRHVPSATEWALDELALHNRTGPVSLRWIYLHMIRELARHAGHGDILREQILAADRERSRLECLPLAPPWSRAWASTWATRSSSSCATII